MVCYVAKTEVIFFLEKNMTIYLEKLNSVWFSKMYNDFKVEIRSKLYINHMRIYLHEF